ncbi:hypothetical protein Y032_0024g982 [Ancylostoma ceylanicum]|uniref:Uncharacterized protein n=1 Tax=Ancylostoma ceylanicum TaxID=53326 RepID=A0A016UXA9_9BILA|nr:hypothetical protein Y032_0024g982 [Ancylostoma ceylanicum]
MEHLWITLIPYNLLLLLLRGNLRTSMSIEIARARLPISISQPVIADGAAPKIGWQGPTVWENFMVRGKAGSGKFRGCPIITKRTLESPGRLSGIGNYGSGGF